MSTPAGQKTASEAAAKPAEPKKKVTRSLPPIEDHIPPLDYSFLNLEVIDSILTLEARPNASCSTKVPANLVPIKVAAGGGSENNEVLGGGKSGSKCLKLNNNSIKTTDGLQHVINELFWFADRVVWVDLCFNMIETVDETLLCLHQLQVLYLHGNKIKNLKEVEKIARLQKLQKLTLYGNPIDKERNYRVFVVDAVPQVIALDFTHVSKEDRKKAQTFHSMVFGKVDPKARARHNSGDQDAPEQPRGRNK